MVGEAVSAIGRKLLVGEIDISWVDCEQETINKTETISMSVARFLISITMVDTLQ